MILKGVPAVAFTANIWKIEACEFYIPLTVHLFDKDFEVVPLSCYRLDN